MSIGQEKQVVPIVPGNLIDFKFELFLGFCTIWPSIHKGHKIFFVTNSNGLAIWTPANIYILTCII